MNRPESPSHPSTLRSRGTTPALAVLVLLLFAQPHVASANWPFNSNFNVPLSTTSGDQVYPISISDGNGGAFVAWIDTRNDPLLMNGLGNDVYMEHVAGSGVVDSSWPADGLPICTAQGDQAAEEMCSDGAGGVIIVWSDARGTDFVTYAQRVNAAGVPLWGTNGVAVCPDLGEQVSTGVVSDGAGGAIVTWEDWRNGQVNTDIYAQRLNAAGTPQWTANGVPLCTATNRQALSQTIFNFIVSDAAGGAIVVWQDKRNGTDYDLYAQRVNAAGIPQWSADGVAVCTGLNDQIAPGVATDGGGGAIVVWEEKRNGVDYDIYTQRVNAAGVPKWTPGGAVVCQAAGNQVGPSVASDGAGGVIVSWMDSRAAAARPYAQRMSSGGAPLWTANGVNLSTSLNRIVDPPPIVTDGSGGAIVSWAEFNNGNNDIYAQRVLASGIIPVPWPASGRKVCTAVLDQDYPTICTDGGGKAIVAWQDFRTGSDWDIYAQLVSPAGFLGVPNPVLRPIADLLWDQGGFVNVRWDASYLDTDEPYVVDHYWVLRSAPSSRIIEALAKGRVLAPEQFGAASDALRANNAAAAAASEVAPNALVVTVTGANSYYWEPLRRIDALHAVAGYSYVAPTTSDSTAGGNPLTSFMVIAYDPSGTVYLPSDPDSGYSVDNLPPGTPGHLTGNYTAGATHLHWDPNVDPDLANYRVYRGSSASFIPGPANLIASPPDTGLADVGFAGSFYKLSAMDIHGNESGFALLSPSGTTDVGSGPALELSLARPAPNPARGAARIGFALPHETRVSLAIYDVAGRKERVLIDGVLPAGEHTQNWDLHDDAGSTAHAGLYFVRLEAESRRLVQRLVVSGK